MAWWDNGVDNLQSQPRGNTGKKKKPGQKRRNGSDQRCDSDGMARIARSDAS